MMKQNNAPIVPTTTIDTQLFLAQVLAHGEENGTISHLQAEQLYQNVTVIAHKLITMKTQNLADLAELRTQTQNAFTLISLGLEYGSNRNLHKAARQLLKNRTVQFFQIGNTITDKVVARARKLIQSKGLLTPIAFPGHNTEEFIIFNKAEHDFLNATLQYSLNIQTPQITIRETIPWRTITQLNDIKLMENQLACLENRRHYLAALPLEQILKPDTQILKSDTMLNFTLKPVESITLGLIVNLTLHRQIDLQLDYDALNDFTELAYTDGQISNAIRQRLLDWIKQYLDQHHQPHAVQQYAAAYWDECLHDYQQIRKYR